MDNFTRTRKYYKLEEKAPDHTLWELTLEKAMDMS